MQPQVHPTIKNSVSFVQPEFSPLGFLAFEINAPDEDAYLGALPSDTREDAEKAAATLWPEKVADVWIVDAAWTAYQQARMEIEMLRNPWPYAYHHAGYLMAAHSFGWMVTETSLRPRVHSWRGRCDIDCFSYGFTRLHVDELILTDERETGDRYAVYFLAGSVAEFRFDPGRTEWRGNHDIIEADLSIMQFADGCEKGCLEWLKARAARLVDRCWPSIELVAAALVDRRELIGRELDGVLNSVSSRTVH